MAKGKENYAKEEVKDLLKLLEEKEKQLFEAGVALSKGKGKNVHASKKIRLEIAKIKTALRTKDLGN